MSTGIYRGTSPQAYQANPSRQLSGDPTPSQPIRVTQELYNANLIVNDRLQMVLNRLRDLNYRLLGDAPSLSVGEEEKEATVTPDVTRLFIQQTRMRELLEYIEESIAALERL